MRTEWSGIENVFFFFQCFVNAFCSSLISLRFFSSVWETFFKAIDDVEEISRKILSGIMLFALLRSSDGLYIAHYAIFRNTSYPLYNVFFVHFARPVNNYSWHKERATLFPHFLSKTLFWLVGGKWTRDEHGYLYECKKKIASTLKDDVNEHFMVAVPLTMFTRFLW